MHPHHDPCFLSTLISLPPLRHECCHHLFPFDLRVCQTLNFRHPPRLLQLRVCQTLNPYIDFPSCSNMPPSTRSLVLSARSHPAHFPPHCSSPNLIQSCPALGKLLSTILFPLRPSPRSPDLCAKYEHRTVSCALSSSYTSPFQTVFLFD